MERQLMNFRIVAFAVLLIGFSVRAEESLDDKVARLVMELDSDQFNIRDAAAEALLDLPCESVGILEKAHTAAGPEVRARIDKALPILRFKLKCEPGRKRIAAINEQKQRAMLAAYEKLSKHDPAWEAKAREAVRLFAMAMNNDPARNNNEFWDGCKIAYDAVAAGCDDPFVNYLYARGIQFQRGDYRQQLLKAAPMMEKSSYPIDWRISAMVRTAQMLVTGEAVPESDKKEALRLWDVAKSALPELLHAPSIPVNTKEVLLSVMVELGKKLMEDRKAGFDQLDAILEKEIPGDAIINKIKAEFYAHYAWDARGNGWGNTVTGEGGKLMVERLELARKEVETAWAKDPTDFFAPYTMMDVVLGLGGDREQMELWFNRCVENNPSYGAVYDAKEWYLQPRWHGSAEETLEFGRFCTRLHIWDNNVFKVLDRAHQHLWNNGDTEKYYGNAAVWVDIRSVYEPYLRRFPKDIMTRAEYSFRAGWCGQYQVALDQIAAMPPDEQEVYAVHKLRCQTNVLNAALKQVPGQTFQAQQRTVLVREWEDAGGDFRVGDWIETKFNGQITRREVLQTGDKMTVTETKTPGGKVIRWKEVYTETDPMTVFGKGHKIEFKVEDDKASIEGKGEFACKRRDTYYDGKIIVKEWLCKDLPFGGPVKTENGEGKVLTQCVNFGRGEKK
jgi:tetratricopeptide (TPR) repeat protein